MGPGPGSLYSKQQNLCEQRHRGIEQYDGGQGGDGVEKEKQVAQEMRLGREAGPSPRKGRP